MTTTSQSIQSVSLYSSLSPAAQAHSLGKSILLHLPPGLLALSVFILIARPVEALGYPSIMPWLIAVSITIIPVELAYLLYQGKRNNGRFSLEGVILYNEPLKASLIALWTAISFLKFSLSIWPGSNSPVDGGDFIGRNV